MVHDEVAQALEAGNADEAATASDPSMTAEQCLEAVPYLVLAVALASADLE
ncbi:hypothetical protein ACFVXQ_33570 [Kitasatospora sp. NPDC058263]